MLTANELRNYIMQGLPCDHVEVLTVIAQHFHVIAGQALHDVVS